MKKGKIIYILSLILITVLVSTVYFSYAFFTSRNEEHGKLNIVVGTLNYKIESSDLKDNQITLEAGETKEITITLTSLNNIDSKYELYYTLDSENTDVEVGYSSDTVDNVSGTISANGTKEVTVVLINSSDTSSTVTFDVLGGLINNELALNNGNSLNQELSSCPYSLGTEFTFDYSGSVEEFVVPCSGTYKLEVYGAQGGNATTTYVGGLGGYSYGNVDLKRSDMLYVAVGSQGSNATGNNLTAAGGYNGGGSALTTNYSASYINSGGGGATHIAIGNTNRGELYNYENYKSEVLIVAGGGGGGSYWDAYWNGNGGTGGGTTGGDAVYIVAADGVYAYGLGASQTSGGYCYNNSTYNLGSFGKASTSTYNHNSGAAGAGGGGGYYGGGGGCQAGQGGGGGSGYIDGVINGSTKNGVRSGNGYAKITYIDKYSYENSVTITKVSVNNEEASKVSEEEYDYYYSIEAGSIELNIEVETFNPDATVEITTLDGDALTTPFTINPGDNFFKIKVTSESQEKSEEYILNIEGLTCPYSPNTEFTFAYSGNVEEFVVPCSGTYKLEVWGAQGADATTTYSGDANITGGKGGYSYGNKSLAEGEKLYLVVGGAGSRYSGGYNGGGSAYPDWNVSTAGGGATHMAIGDTNRGELKNYANYRGEVLIVAGGGGGGTNAHTAVSYVGGSGGGLTGGNGSQATTSTSVGGTGGSQTAAGVSSFTAGGFGYGGYQNGVQDSGIRAGGGGGWYGGGAGTKGGGGGSGYIGGVTGGSTSNGIQSGNGKAKITLLSID